MKTVKEITEFINVANSWLNQQDGQQSKLTYAVARVIKRAMRVNDKYNEDLEDIRVDHCVVDEKGVIVRDSNGNYQFTKDGIAAYHKKRRQLLFSAEHELEPYYATSVTPKLDARIVEAFRGFVVKEDYEPAQVEDKREQEGQEESETE
jgi:hypothetical protein